MSSESGERRETLGRANPIGESQDIGTSFATIVKGQIASNIASRGKPLFEVLEVDIPDRSAKRMRVLAALGVTEVWRYDGRKMRVYLLLGNGEYIESERSDCCPLLPMSAIERFVPMQDKMDDNAVVGEFCGWIEEQRAAGRH